MTKKFKIFNYRDIELDNINYDSPKKVKGGGYISLMTYGDNKQRLFIQTPRLRTSSGIYKNNIKSYIELVLDKCHWPFWDFLINLDEHNIVTVSKNSTEWFNHEFPISIVEELYYSNIKMFSSNLPPRIKFKLHMSKGEILCELYNNQSKVILDTEVNKEDKIISVLELVGLKFLKQKYYIEWKIVKMKVYKVTINNLLDNEIDSINVDVAYSKKDMENLHKFLDEGVDKLKTCKNKEFDNDLQNNEMDLEIMSNYSSDVEEFIETLDDIESEHQIDLDSNTELEMLDNEFKLSKENLELYNKLDKNDLIEILKNTKNEMNNLKNISKIREDEINNIRNTIKKCIN